MEDRRNVGENGRNPGDGPDQRAQSLTFMMMMVMMMMKTLRHGADFFLRVRLSVEARVRKFSKNVGATGKF